ncbi:hypothetical protein LDENG_00269010, partial [Lucifuga dentata]
SWRILLFGTLNLLCTCCLLTWCSSTNSMVLTLVSPSLTAQYLCPLFPVYMTPDATPRHTRR